ncbi:MAG: glycosyltransferase family 4 protein [Novosphingobium sp.]
MKPKFLRSTDADHDVPPTGENMYPTPPAPAVAQGGRVAYLVNAYPKLSHSFIRTEIAALERRGFAVERFTVRRSPGPFTSEEDAAEAERTTPLLDRNGLGLLAAAGRRLIARPRGTAGALALALRSAGARGLVRACAYFAEAAALAEALERRKVRHVHVHFGTNPAAVARLAARMAPVTYSFTAHGPDEFDAPVALDLRGKIADAGFVAGVSSFGRGQLMRWADPGDWDRIHVVRCGVAPCFLAAEAQSDSGLDSSRLVCVARLDAQKGLPLLLSAAGRVAAHRRFTLNLIGDGPGRGVIEDRIAALGLGGTIRLLGWRGPDEVREALIGARALVLPSFAEGLPVVLMEALALGRPVIASAIAGVPELVDSRNGWLIPSGSVDALAQALNAVLATPAERLLAMGQVGRARVRADHDPDANAGRLAELLQAFV